MALYIRSAADIPEMNTPVLPGHDNLQSVAEAVRSEKESIPVRGLRFVYMKGFENRNLAVRIPSSPGKDNRSGSSCSLSAVPA